MINEEFQTQYNWGYWLKPSSPCKHYDLDDLRWTCSMLSSYSSAVLPCSSRRSSGCSALQCSSTSSTAFERSSRTAFWTKWKRNPSCQANTYEWISNKQIIANKYMSSELAKIKMRNTTLGYAIQTYMNLHLLTSIHGKLTLPCRHCSCQRGPEAVTISACTCLIKLLLAQKRKLNTISKGRLVNL